MRQELMDLALRALRIDHMFRNTPCVQASGAKIDALPHQISALRYALDQALKLGSVRLMIADDVGLGKTVIAGMIMKELQLRGRIRRILVVVPKSLLLQWERELRDKFEMDPFVVRSKNDLKDVRDRDLVVVSLGLVKRHRNLNELGLGWDMVVFDEAHNLTVRELGGNVRKTKGYEAAEKLAGLAPNVLLLTATPHHGKPVDFRYRLRLLDPNVPLEKDSPISSFVSRYVIRRLREEAVDFNGKRLIPDRESLTILVDFSPEEKLAYERLLEYVKEYYNLYKITGKKSYGFLAAVLQKRASSSIYALRESLVRRKNKLEGLRNNPHAVNVEEFERRLKRAEESSEDLERLEGAAIEEVVDTSGLEREIAFLDALIKTCNSALGHDSKMMKLREKLEKLLVDQESKVIVFTQYRDTLNHLFDGLHGSISGIVELHGKMGIDERLNKEREFLERGRVLLATDVASEGLNLQMANFVVNYDIPWNPTKLDQRIGRVHRYGQKRKVVALNMLVNDTIDNRVYDVLMKKLENIREELGPVFNYLGILIDEADIERAVEMAIETGSIEKAVEEVYTAIDLRNRGLKELEDLLDKNRIRIPESDPRCPEGELIEESDVRELVLGALSVLDPKSFEYSNEVFTLRYVPHELTADAGNLAPFKGTFSRETASRSGGGLEYVGVEHPLVRSVINYLKDAFSSPGGVKLEAENKYTKGWLWLVMVRGEVPEVPLDPDDPNRKRDLSEEKLVAILEDEVRGSTRVLRPSAVESLFVVRELEEAKPHPPGPVEMAKDEINGDLKKILEQLRDDIVSRITDEINRLDKLATENSLSLMEKQKYEGKMHERFSKSSEIMNRFNTLIKDGPKWTVEELAVVRLFPYGYSELGLEFAEQLLDEGRKGEEIVIECEKKKGAKVEDLRDKFTAGVDLVSYREDGARLIEVKTTKGDHGKIYITQREWEVMCMEKRRRERHVSEILGMTPRMDIARSSVHLYIVDLERSVDCASIIDITDPCSALGGLAEKYRQYFYKIVIPYGELIKSGTVRRS